MAAIQSPLAQFRAIGREQWLKVGLLFSWFFCAISAFWLLEPVRVAALLSHLGAAETPYLKIASMVAVAVVVAVYSRVVDKVSRKNLALGVAALFAGLFVAFWLALHAGGEALRGSRPFVWAFYILADVYSTVMVAVFWTYTNDIVTRAEADRLYGPIGVCGILGGIAGGLGADVLARPLGPTNLLLLCAGLSLGGASLAVACERLLNPPERRRSPAAAPRNGVHAALEGAREVCKSRYLLLLVGIMVSYEITSTMNDFAINVMFERSFRGNAQITQMYGRLGWVVNCTALAAQLFLVPLVLPRKRLALLLVPAAMTVTAIGIVALPVVGMVFLLAASDNGLSYSVQQSTKETLYVPLSDVQRYKAKAFIDMFVLRAAKASAAFIFIGITAVVGLSLRLSVAVSVAYLATWTLLAVGLAREYHALTHAVPPRTPDRGPAAPEPERGSLQPRRRVSLA